MGTIARQLASSDPQTALSWIKNFLTKPHAKTRLSHSSRSGAKPTRKQRLSLPWIRVVGSTPESACSYFPSMGAE